jgi:hypothetical protein
MAEGLPGEQKGCRSKLVALIGFPKKKGLSEKPQIFFPDNAKWGKYQLLGLLFPLSTSKMIKNNLKWQRKRGRLKRRRPLNKTFTSS